MRDIAGIVVHYGSFDLLQPCLDHLCPQVVEVVVVNHESKPIPSSLGDRYKNVRWIEPGRNMGFSRGVNRAMSLLEQQYVVVVNPDTRIRKGMVESLLVILDQDPKAGMAGPRLYGGDGELQTSSYRFPTLVQLIGYLLGVAGKIPGPVKRILARTGAANRYGQLDPHDREKTVDMVTGACFAVRRQALLDSGPFDPGFFLYYEEKDLCKRLHGAGWSIVFTPHAAATHLIGGSGSPGSPGAHRHRAIGALRYFLRHGRFCQRLGARLMIGIHSGIALARGKDASIHRSVLAACFSRRLPCGFSS